MRTEYNRKNWLLIAQLSAGVTSLLAFILLETLYRSEQKQTGLIFLFNGVIFILGGFFYVLKNPSIHLGNDQVQFNNFFSPKTFNYKDIEDLAFDDKGKLSLKIKGGAMFEFWIKVVPNEEIVSFQKNFSEKIKRHKS